LTAAIPVGCSLSMVSEGAACQRRLLNSTAWHRADVNRSQFLSIPDQQQPLLHCLEHALSAVCSYMQGSTRCQACCCRQCACHVCRPAPICLCLYTVCTHSLVQMCITHCGTGPGALRHMQSDIRITKSTCSTHSRETACPKPNPGHWPTCTADASICGADLHD
jgi:hypothetical protein